MLKWFQQLKYQDKKADELVEKAHQSNVAIVKKAKTRSAHTARQADKELKKVYDVAEKIYLATGQKP